eukprot:scaffold478_cov409-Prasinococcus_capsulatus_cf.AAC.20
MDNIQNRTPCEAAMVIEGLPGPNQQGKSLASTLMYLTGDMTEAYIDGRPFVYGGIWNMADNDECAAMNQRGAIECYFEPLSFTCSMNRTRSGGLVWKATLEQFGSGVEQQSRASSSVIDVEDPDNFPGISFTNSGSHVHHRSRLDFGSGPRGIDEETGAWPRREEEALQARPFGRRLLKRELPKSMPAELVEEDCTLGDRCYSVKEYEKVPQSFASRGLFWWRSLQLSYIMRPNQYTKDQLNLDKIKALLEVGRLPTIGVHIPFNPICDPAIAQAIGKHTRPWPTSP